MQACTNTNRYASNCLGKKKKRDQLGFMQVVENDVWTHAHKHLYTQPDAHIAVLDGMGYSATCPV